MNYILAPSILAADFKQLGNEIKRAEAAGAGYLHIDVMDGAYVPSISFGMPVIQSIRSVTDLPFDVHLMIEDPDRYVDAFAACGADILTVHAEACTHLDRVLSHIREKGMKAGVSLNPATPLQVLDYVWDKIDMVLIMTVNPGFGGQKYISSSTVKIRALREKIVESGYEIDIQVDGGIYPQNVETVLEAGANVIVSGSGVFGGDIEANGKAFMDILSKYNEEAK